MEKNRTYGYPISDSKRVMYTKVMRFIGGDIELNLSIPYTIETRDDKTTYTNILEDITIKGVKPLGSYVSGHKVGENFESWNLSTKDIVAIEKSVAEGTKPIAAAWVPADRIDKVLGMSLEDRRKYLLDKNKQQGTEE